jgi:hypothetical protein
LWATRRMVAHNASFDRRFWQAELARRGPMPRRAQPLCLHHAAVAPPVPAAPGHKLGTLAAFHALPAAGRAHRALADAEVAAALLGRIQADLCSPSHLTQRAARCDQRPVPWPTRSPADWVSSCCGQTRMICSIAIMKAKTGWKSPSGGNHPEALAAQCPRQF